MVGKCINKTKNNKDKPVCPCEALCGAVRDPAGSQSLPGISGGFGPVLRLCGGRKKKQEKALALSVRLGDHNHPQCGRFQGLELALFRLTRFEIGAVLSQKPPELSL